jgi:hypothetical protein
MVKDLSDLSARIMLVVLLCGSALHSIIHENHACCLVVWILSPLYYSRESCLLSCCVDPLSTLLFTRIMLVVLLCGSALHSIIHENHACCVPRKFRGQVLLVDPLSDSVTFADSEADLAELWGPVPVGTYKRTTLRSHLMRIRSPTSGFDKKGPDPQHCIHN